MPKHIHDLALELLDEQLPDATEVRVTTNELGGLVITVHDGEHEAQTTINAMELNTAPEMAELIRTAIDALADELEGIEDDA